MGNWKFLRAIGAGGVVESPQYRLSLSNTIGGSDSQWSLRDSHVRQGTPPVPFQSRSFDEGRRKVTPGAVTEPLVSTDSRKHTALEWKRGEANYGAREDHGVKTGARVIGRVKADSIARSEA